MKRTVSIVLGSGIALAVGIAMTSAPGGAEERPWFDSETGAIDIELMPERIKVSTALFDAGYGWLESRNFREPTNNGPFLVFENVDSKEPSFWYYKGMDVVPIGTKFISSDTTGTIADEADQEG